VTVSAGRATFPTEVSGARELLLLSHQRAYLDKLSRFEGRASAAQGQWGTAPAAAT
jgi:hypothetical protein